MQPIPTTYKVLFPLWPKNLPFPDSAESLIVNSQIIRPPTAVIHPFVLQCLMAIAQDIAFHIGKEFTTSTSTQLSFSKKEGIKVLSSSDHRIQEILKNLQMIQLPKEIVPEKIMFNPIQFLFSRFEDFESQEVNLEIGYVEEIQAMGATSAPMRYPHMYKDLIERFKNIRENPNTKVCLLGPGFNKPEKGTPFSPQFAEMLSLFPNAGFLLLEKNPEVIKALNSQIKVLGGISYDGTCHRLLGPKCQIESNSIITPPSYFPLLKEMGTSFTSLWKNFAEKKNQKIDQEKMFEGYGKIKPVFLDINPQKVELREGDFSELLSKDGEAGTFDVVIATLSLMYALAEQPTQKEKQELFKKYLNLLKEGGSMYIDAYVYETLLADDFKNELPIIWEKLPLSDFQPGLQGDLGQMSYLTSQSKDFSRVISSTSVWVLTRI